MLSLTTLWGGGSGATELKRGRRTRRSARPAHRPIRVETLEERRLLSISVLFGPKTVNEGSSYADAAVILDPGATSYTAASVNYGDGTVDNNPTLLNVNGDELLILDHIFGDEGSYNVTASVQDNLGQQGSNAAAITVNEAAGTLSGLPSSAGQGFPLSFTGSFTDPGWGVQYAYGVSWGDGSSGDTGQGSIDVNGSAHTPTQGHFDLSHTYSATGSYPVAVSLYEVDDGVQSSSPIATQSATVEVAARTQTTTTLSASPDAVAYGQPVAFTATVAPNTGGVVPTGTVTFIDGTTVLGIQTLDNNEGATLDVSTLPLGSSVVTASYSGDSAFKPSAATEPEPWITTVAGGGDGGYSGIGDGGPATAATFWNPQGVAVDAAGNIYIADSNDNRIREVNASTGLITTFAGGGPASAPQLSYPMGVAVDASGNVFIADTGDDVVREVVHGSGEVATVAGNGNHGYSGDGGPATAASFDGPVAIAVDADDNVFIADLGNNVVREVIHSTGDIITVVGNGNSGDGGDNGPASDASFCGTGIAVDGSGDIFVDDGLDIRELDASTGIIATVAGNGMQGYIGDNGPATAAELGASEGIAVDASGNLYIADTWNYVVREVEHGTGEITTVAGGGGGGNGPATDGAIQFPVGVAVDPAGNLFITDSESCRVLEVTPGVSAAVTVRAPTSTALTASDSSPVFGDWVTLTATVTDSIGYAPAGTVGFFDGNTLIGTASPDNNGTASIEVTSLSVGSHSVTASYGGDGNSTASVSSGVTVDVGQASTTAAISPTVLTDGQSVTLIAQVAEVSPSAATPDGTVTFMAGTTILGVATLDANGTATLQVTPALPLGGNQITATYSGSVNFAGCSASATVNVIAPLVVSTNGDVSAIENSNGSFGFSNYVSVTDLNPGASISSVCFAVDDSNGNNIGGSFSTSWDTANSFALYGAIYGSGSESYQVTVSITDTVGVTGVASFNLYT